jgi:hypothetical protein
VGGAWQISTECRHIIVPILAESAATLTWMTMDLTGAAPGDGGIQALQIVERVSPRC